MSLIFSKALKSGTFEVHDEKPDHEFVHVIQIHGKDIICNPDSPVEGDGILSQLEELHRPLVIKTADCIPAVLESHSHVVFLHAGWRGVAQEIFGQKEVREMKPESVYIGPCIHSCCYEVSEDFKKNFPMSENFSTREGKVFFNLPQEAADQILKLYPQVQIEIDSQCTMCNSRFHSFRRNGTKLRNWNLYRKGN